MPYIPKEERYILDDTIDDAITFLKDNFPLGTKRKGATNYVITRVVLGSMRPDDKWSYNSISNAIAVLRDAATEMERRLMAKREDLAISQNGDLPEYA